MSTDINIKKKLAILEESVTITNDASSINFTGNGITSSNIDGNVTVSVPGGSGTTTYYFNETVTQTPYKEFSSIPTTAVEQVIPFTIAGGTTTVIAEYQTPSGVPGTTQIPAGLWQLFLHFNATSAGQEWIIRPTIYKRDIGGIETLLFTPDPEIVIGMSTTTTMYLLDGVFPATTLLATDRIVVKIAMQNTTGVSQTANFRTEGSQHYSVALTTLNQVVPTNAVTSVTGTAPIASSGGTTPAISISQSSALSDGYLSSSDWSTFNAKQNAITLTTTGTSGAATLVGSTLNIPNYATSSSGIWGIANSSGVYTYYSTWALAVAAATSGQTIELFADITESSVSYTLKNGVNINGNGHTITHTSNASPCFIDNAVTVSCNINNLIIAKTCTAIASNVINLTASYNLIDFQGSIVNINSTTQSTGYYGFSTVGVGGKYYNLRVISNGNGIIINQASAECHNFNVYSSINNSSYLAVRNNGNLINSYAESEGGVGIYSPSATSTVNCVGKSTSYVGIRGFGTNTTAISVSGYAWISQGGNLLNCTGISTSGNACLTAASGIFTNCTFISSSAQSVDASASGSIFNNCYFSSTSNSSANLSSCEVYNSVFISSYNNAAGYAVNQPSIITNCQLTVTNAGANCISGGVSTLKYSNNVYKGSTTPVNANITQGIINTQDNQGNILL